MLQDVKNMLRITTWYQPEERISSVYGVVTMAEWTKLEQARLAQAGIKTVVKSDKSGKRIGIWRINKKI